VDVLGLIVSKKELHYTCDSCVLQMETGLYSKWNLIRYFIRQKSPEIFSHRFKICNPVIPFTYIKICGVDTQFHIIRHL